MNDETAEDIYGFIYEMEDKAWEILREEGLSDAEVWDSESKPLASAKANDNRAPLQTKKATFMSQPISPTEYSLPNR